MWMARLGLAYIHYRDRFHFHNWVFLLVVVVCNLTGSGILHSSRLGVLEIQMFHFQKRYEFCLVFLVEEYLSVVASDF